MLITLKGLPLSYNRDLQEDKQGFFDAVDATSSCLEIMARLLASTRFNGEAMAAAASDPATLATEVAEYLVRKGVPFRRAHEVVGQAVRLAARRRMALSELTLEQWRALDPAFDEHVVGLFDPLRALAARTVVGSPGPGPLRKAMVRAAVAVKRNREWLQVNKTAY
jgi:argininosuccinate lyase